MAIPRLFTSFSKSLYSNNIYRSISLSAPRNLKEIKETKEGNTTIVEAIVYPDPKEHLMLKSHDKACPVCAAGIDLKHTDVLILKQFTRNNYTMLPRRITGLCCVQQKRVGIMVSMAHKAGLLGGNPKKRIGWKKYNQYYDEDTIKQRYY